MFAISLYDKYIAQLTGNLSFHYSQKDCLVIFGGPIDHRRTDDTVLFLHGTTTYV